MNFCIYIHFTYSFVRNLYFKLVSAFTKFVNNTPINKFKKKNAAIIMNPTKNPIEEYSFYNQLQL